MIIFSIRFYRWCLTIDASLFLFSECSRNTSLMGVTSQYKLFLHCMLKVNVQISVLVSKPQMLLWTVFIQRCGRIGICVLHGNNYLSIFLLSLQYLYSLACMGFRCRERIDILYMQLAINLWLYVSSLSWSLSFNRQTGRSIHSPLSGSQFSSFRGTASDSAPSTKGIFPASSCYRQGNKSETFKTATSLLRYDLRVLWNWNCLLRNKIW